MKYAKQTKKFIFYFNFMAVLFLWAIFFKPILNRIECELFKKYLIRSTNFANPLRGYK